MCSVISVVEKFIQCYLDLNGVEKTAPIYNSGLVFSKSNLGLSALANSLFFNLFGYTYSQKEQEQVDTLLQKLSHEGDSVGGIVSCRIERVPPGLGDPMYEKLSAKLAFAMLSIPASRGFEIGEGFSAASMTGSEHNDPLFIHEGGVQSSTNHAGGVLGGISTGMPIFFRVAFKPTSSVRKEMATVTKEMTPEAFAKLETAICEVPAKGRAPISTKPIVVTMGEERSELTPRRREQSAVSSFAKASSATHGTSASARHDPCVAVRAVCVVEAMAALVIADAWLMNRSSSHQNFT